MKKKTDTQEEKIKKSKRFKNKKEKTETVVVEKNASFNLLEVIVIILMTSLVVGVSTGIIVYKNYGKIESSSKVSNSKYIDEFMSAYNNILNGYVEKIDEKELVNAAIEGMYNHIGDPYTGFLDQVSTDDLTDRLDGEYQGIGVEITKVEEGILVVSVFDDSPADEAGILAEDIITKINGEDVSKESASVVSELIKKNKKNKIEITLIRNNETKIITVDIKKVSVPSISKENYDGVGYIRIDTFSATTFTQFKEALDDLEDEEIKSLIIDVRGNGGGYLNSAVDIAELFIEKGKTVYGLEKKDKATYYEDTTSDKKTYKVAVLINGSTASASEILAAALKESYGATLVGTLSYGKGTVQETRELESGGMIKYTTAYWLTPKGNNINGIGLSPDKVVNASYVVGMKLEDDLQLKEAINIVK